MKATARTHRMRFGEFEVDLRSGELYRSGVRLRLQEQPFQVLTLLLEQPGEMIPRQVLREKLWPADTFVDFDTGLNNAVRKLREALGDSAEEPRYIETLHRRGYRFIARVENGAPPAHDAGELHLVAALPKRPPARVWYRRLGVIAGGLAVLLMAGVLVSWRVFFARRSLAGTDVILLANFVNKTGDPIFDNSLDRAVEVKLTESPFLSLLPQADVQATMGMMRHAPNERVTQQLGIEICRRRGLKAVVVPEIDSVGDEYLITLDAIDAQSQMSLARRQEEAKNKDGVVAALGKAGAQLRRQLGESLSSLEKHDVPLELATTSSLEALQAYSAGQALYRSGKRREAIPLFARAIEVDPQFCAAYAGLGSAYHSVGDEEATRENFARAFALKDGRLTQEENFETTARYDDAVTGNLEKEIAVAESYKEAYPRSVSAANTLGIAFAKMGRTEEALREFQWAISNSPVPSSSTYSNASQALLILDRFDDAKKMLDQWHQKGSLTSFQRLLRYQIAFLEKDTSTMEQLAREAPSDDITWAHLQMGLAFLRGDLKKLRSLSETLVKQQNHANRMENVAHEFAWRASVESFVGNYDAARSLEHQAEEAGSGGAAGLMLSAQALGEAGDATQADAIAEKIDRLFPEDTFEQSVTLPAIRSISERQRGNAAKAAELLAPAAQYPNAMVFYHRGQAYMAGADYAKAASDFTTVISHRGWPDWEIFCPLAQLGLAQTYAKQGDRGRKVYDEFFTTWKDADPDIPILRQAKIEYSKLTATPTAAPSSSEKKQ